MTDHSTVVMAAHRVHDYLDTAIASVFSQTTEAHSLLLVDDSSDESVTRYVRATWEGERLSIARAGNLGIGMAYRMGVEHARTEYVALLDSDDVMLPDRLEAQIAYMDSHPDISVLGSWAQVIDDTGEVTGTRRVPTGEREIRRLMWANPVIAPSVMLRRGRVIQAGGFSPRRRRADHETWIRLTLAGLRFANLSTPLIQYRVGRRGPNRGLEAALHTGAVALWGVRALRAPWYAYPLATLAAGEKLLPRWAVRVSERTRRRFDPRALP